MVTLAFEEPEAETASCPAPVSRKRTDAAVRTSTRTNVTWLAKRVADEMDGAEMITGRSAEPRSYVLCSRMPPMSVLRAEGVAAAKRARRQATIDAELELATLEPPQQQSPPTSFRSLPESSKAVAKAQKAPTQAPKRPIAAYEVFRAIEKKDIGLLMAARDQDFSLLVSKTPGGDTPLLHTIRLGEAHRDVAVLLTGALSRYINNVDEQPTKQVKSTLRSIQANLKLAITATLKTNQTELLSSYLQVRGRLS